MPTLDRLLAALSTSAAFDRQPTRREMADIVVDPIECGLVVCDRQSVLIHADRAAHLELTHARVMRPAGGTIRAPAASQPDFGVAVQDAVGCFAAGCCGSAGPTTG